MCTIKIDRRALREAIKDREADFPKENCQSKVSA